MTREEAIEAIERLYPPDSGYADTAAVGRQLLQAAQALEWRSAPDKILFELCRLNEEKERIENEMPESSYERHKEINSTHQGRGILSSED